MRRILSSNQAAARYWAKDDQLSRLAKSTLWTCFHCFKAASWCRLSLETIAALVARPAAKKASAWAFASALSPEPASAASIYHPDSPVWQASLSLICRRRRSRLFGDGCAFGSEIGKWRSCLRLSRRAMELLLVAMTETLILLVFLSFKFLELDNCWTVAVWALASVLVALFCRECCSDWWRLWS